MPVLDEIFWKTQMNNIHHINGDCFLYASFYYPNYFEIHLGTLDSLLISANLLSTITTIQLSFLPLISTQTLAYLFHKINGKNLYSSKIRISFELRLEIHQWQNKSSIKALKIPQSYHTVQILYLYRIRFM